MAATPASSLADYPIPVIEHSEELVAGYFLDGDDLSDAAVMNIQSFAPASENNTAYSEFQSMIRKFLQLSANKTRLVVDLRGNPGES